MPYKESWPCKSNPVRLGSSPRASTRVGGLRAFGRGPGRRASPTSLLLSLHRRPRRRANAPTIEIHASAVGPRAWHQIGPGTGPCLADKRPLAGFCLDGPCPDAWHRNTPGSVDRPLFGPCPCARHRGTVVSRSRLADQIAVRRRRAGRSSERRPRTVHPTNCVRCSYDAAGLRAHRGRRRGASSSDGAVRS